VGFFFFYYLQIHIMGLLGIFYILHFFRILSGLVNSCCKLVIVEEVSGYHHWVCM
jgi:hypothetical protein